MLRAGLVGLPTSGKTTLFQLLTSAREAPRSHGKAEANVGVSRVADERLDRLSAMFDPKKRTPATVEFADMAAAPSTQGSAASLLDVVAYRNADALLHVVRTFEDPSVPHPKGSIDARRDAQTIEEEFILADPGVVERRLERLEKDLKKLPTPDLKKEYDLLIQCRATLDEGRALRTLAATEMRGASVDSVSFREAAAVVINLGGVTSPTRNTPRKQPGGLDRGDRRGRVGVCANRARIAARHGDAEAFMEDLGLQQSGLDRVIRAAGSRLSRSSSARRRLPGVVDPRHSARGPQCDSLGYRARLHSRRVVLRNTTVAGSLAACRDRRLRLEGKCIDGDVLIYVTPPETRPDRGGL